MAESAGKSAFIQPKWEEPKVPSFAEAAYVKKLQDQAQKQKQKELYMGALENIKAEELVGAKIQEEQGIKIRDTINKMGSIYQAAEQEGRDLSPEDLTQLSLLQTDFNTWQKDTKANYQKWKDINEIYMADAKKGADSVLDQDRHKKNS